MQNLLRHCTNHRPHTTRLLYVKQKLYDSNRFGHLPFSGSIQRLKRITTNSYKGDLPGAIVGIQQYIAVLSNHPMEPIRHHIHAKSFQLYRQHLREVVLPCAIAGNLYFPGPLIGHNSSMPTHAIVCAADLLPCHHQAMTTTEPVRPSTCRSIPYKSLVYHGHPM